MRRMFTVRFVSALIITASAAGCRTHGTVREYTQGGSGQVIVKDVSEEDYWKRQVDDHIAAELKHEKPEGGYPTWQAYYQWWYGVIRRKSKPPWKSKEFKSTDDMVNYIKERRRARGLPAYD